MMNRENNEIIKHIKQSADALLLYETNTKILINDYNKPDKEEDLKENTVKLVKSIYKDSTMLIEFLTKDLKANIRKPEEILKLKELKKSILACYENMRCLDEFLKKGSERVNSELLNNFYEAAFNFCRDWQKISNCIDDNSLENNTELTKTISENTTESFDSSSAQAKIF